MTIPFWWVRGHLTRPEMPRLSRPAITPGEWINKRMIRQNLTTLLLSPEQINDCQVPWLRDATPEEAQAFRDEHPNLQGTDREGRPYFPVTIDTEHPEFPQYLREQVHHGLRIFRFWEAP